MDMTASGTNLNLFATMIRRRGWIALVLFSVVFTACVSLIIPLPNIYTAKALILVEGQQVPTDFVRSTVTMGVERRLQIISQEILSRSRLEELVGQFALYPDLEKQGESGEVIAAAMRHDVGVQIQGKRSGLGTDTVAFETGLTLSWVNKLGSEDSGAPPADSPGTSSRVVRTSFASIPGLSL